MRKFYEQDLFSNYKYVEVSRNYLRQSKHLRTLLLNSYINSSNIIFNKWMAKLCVFMFIAKIISAKINLLDVHFLKYLDFFHNILSMVFLD